MTKIILESTDDEMGTKVSVVLNGGEEQDIADVRDESGETVGMAYTDIVHVHLIGSMIARVAADMMGLVYGMMSGEEKAGL